MPNIHTAPQLGIAALTPTYASLDVSVRACSDAVPG